MGNDEILTIVGATVVALAAVSVALRFYTRFFMRAGFKWDDWLILLSLLSTIAADALVLYGWSIRIP